MTQEEMIADYRRHRAEIDREFWFTVIFIGAFVGVVLALVVTIRVLVWSGVMIEGGQDAERRPQFEARP